MKSKLILAVAFSILFSLTFAKKSYADNPLVQTVYTADPAPLVYNGTLYLYTSHDEDGASYYTMNDWRVYSTTDMVNWTDHGAPLSYKTFTWAKGDAWASQCVERNGKFYWYICVTHRSMGRPAIGVAVSDSPTGPFEDPLGYPLVSSDWGDIDPTVFIDDDGQAYLYWGNPNLKYVKLNEDMISYDKEVGIVNVPMKEEYFGKREGNPDRPTLYEEGPWLYKRNGIYYMIYAASGIPENIAYATSDSPTGPWTFRGIIMPTQGRSFTNHPGIIDYKGRSYFFYHNGDLPGGGGFTRSVCVEEFEYNADGSIPTINMTKEGAAAVGNLNPYARVEAETMAWGQGIETRTNSEGGIEVYDIDNGDYIKLKNVDFAAGAAAFAARVSCSGKGGLIELRLDKIDGELIGTVPIGYTGGEDRYDFCYSSIMSARAVHDLYLVFKGEGSGLFTIDYWQFFERTDEPKLLAVNAVSDIHKIDIKEGCNRAQYQITAIYSDGSGENVTKAAVIEPAAAGLVRVDTDKCIITGINYGVADIKVSFKGVSDYFSILVKDFDTEKIVEKLIVNNNASRLTLAETGSFSIIAVYKDGHTEDVTEKASYDNPNKDIAAVANGVVMPKAVGSTEVTVSFKGELGDEVSSSLLVTVIEQLEEEDDNAEPVKADVSGVSFNNKSISLEAGQKKQLMYKVLPVNAGNKKVSFASSNPEVASVDRYGKVTAIDKGVAIITIITEEGSFTDQCEVIVTSEGVNSSDQIGQHDQLDQLGQHVNAEKRAQAGELPVAMSDAALANKKGSKVPVLAAVLAFITAAIAAAGTIIYRKKKSNKGE